MQNFMLLNLRKEESKMKGKGIATIALATMMLGTGVFEPLPIRATFKYNILRNFFIFIIPYNCTLINVIGSTGVPLNKTS